MEISIPVFQQQQSRCVAGVEQLRPWKASFSGERRFPAVQFSDRGQEQYYSCWRIANKLKEKKTTTKKKSSLVEGLSKKHKLELLKTFSESHNDQLMEAAEVFLKKLEEMKQEKRMRKQAKRMNGSSSSSESESDCKKVMVEATTMTNKLAEKEEEEALKENIKVCIGGKCRKLGGEALLAEFERQTANTGASVSVSACKCMGKCKSAPNVSIDSHPTNPLFIGVALDDVASILDTIYPPPPPSIIPASPY